MIQSHGITESLFEFFSKFQPLNDDSDGEYKNDNDDLMVVVEEEKKETQNNGHCLLSKYLEKDNDDYENDHGVKEYHPSLLPIAMVKVRSSHCHSDKSCHHHSHNGPQDCVQMSCILRQEMLKYQQQGQEETISNKTKNKNSKTAAICTISSSSSSTLGTSNSYRDHGDIVYQILCQCIAQEPNPQLYSHLLHRQRKKRIIRKRKKSAIDGDGDGAEEDVVVVVVEDGGYSDRFVKHYASVTDTFHSIIVILSDAENFSCQELQQLFRLWSSWREESGIPVGVVLALNSVVEQQVLSNLDNVSSPNVSRTWVMEEFCIGFETTGTASAATGSCCIGNNTSSTLLKHFLEEFFNSREIGGCHLVIGKRLMDDLLEDFDQYHRSLAQFVLQFKQIFAHHFAKRGSFLALAHCESFMDRYGINVAWFCTDVIARKFMLGSLLNNACPSSPKLLDDIHQLNEDIRYRFFVCHFLIAFGRFVGNNDDDDDVSLLLLGDIFTMLGHYIDQSRKYALFLEMVYNSIREWPVQDLLNVLSRSYRLAYTSYRQSSLSANVHGTNMKYTDDKSKHQDKYKSYIIDSETTNQDEIRHEKAKDFARVLRTSICLSRELQLQPQEIQTLDILWDFRESLVEQLHAFFWESDNREWLRSPLLPFMSCRVVENDSRFSTSPTDIEHRAHVARAISKPSCLEDDRAFDLSVVFHVMDTRMISLKCWFEQFSERILSYTDGSATSKELFQRFAFAVYQLIFCGYVVRSRRKLDGFEKAAMVWAAASYSS